MYDAQIYIKREDLQEVRSYMIRGAYNKMRSLLQGERKKGVVCASAGNHAQGVAYSCNALKIKGTIFMPVVTPNQKIQKVKKFGGEYITIKLIGNTFDEANTAAQEYTHRHNAIYVHPFDDIYTIAGQGTVGKEIYDELKDIEVVVAPIGGGGLIAGVSTYLKSKNKNINIIGVEPEGAAGMHYSFANGKVTSLDKIDTFVDGAAVKTVGENTYAIAKANIHTIIKVPEGKVCTTMIELYQNEGIIAEPAGALAISALDALEKEIKGKVVVCILSGGNNDILRYPEIMERSLVYQGRKHYFIIEFTQKPGQLRLLLDKALGPTDDIVRFEYIKKNNREKGPALVGIELKDKADFVPLVERIQTLGFNYRVVSPDDLLYHYLI
jgi:threonine dehydratase